MTKVMLVEDDNNLREIYAARLAAEGYVIVAAKDGEEALAMLVKEKPDVVLSDIMMPKISGFDMLDIIRSTPETKHTKVIMMTALSQKEDQERGQQLGADRYLVKSQVTLEDVVHVVAEVLGSAAAAPAGGASTPTPEPVAPAAPAPAPTPTPPSPTPTPAPAAPAGSLDSPAPTPLTPPQPEIQIEESPPASSAPTAQSALPPQPPATDEQPTVPAMPTDKPTNGDSLPERRRQRVIQPISDPNEKPDINQLLEKEIANEAAASLTPPASTDAPATPPAPSTTPPPASDQPPAPAPNDIAL